jgi:hypothetical protein
MTLVKIDLLYGMKSFVLDFFLLWDFIAAYFLNLFKISIKVATLLSWILAKGTFMKENELTVLKVSFSTSLN